MNHYQELQFLPSLIHSLFKIKNQSINYVSYLLEVINFQEVFLLLQNFNILLSDELLMLSGREAHHKLQAGKQFFTFVKSTFYAII